ncbi:FAD-dependent monooxygenase [Streptacidiphilus albus]|uniref:FAD-dependent monooxygenase n=1 Tax=Streptacidiphilus albus TaxID=105425 RepID=UPI0005A92EB7|nr:FAD-dependent monooxygenase [Streptacidiphilus albus]
MDPVIIAGAGPVGLTLALALARHQVPTVVLDEGSGVHPEGVRSSVLRADTIDLLARVGYQRVAADGYSWNGWRTLRRNRELAHLPLDPGKVLHLSQHRLQRGLRDAVSASPLVQLVHDSAVAELEQDPDGVNVRTERTWWRGSQLVGCDGPRSTVRRQLKIRFPGHAAADHYAVATVRTDLPFPGEARLHRDPPQTAGSREATARPLPDGVWRLDWRLPVRQPALTPDALVEHLRATLAGWNDGAVPPYELIASTDYLVQQRLAARFQSGRVFLAGDAAHLLGSLGMQNLDEGLRDADNLAWKLALVWHNCAPEQLLTSYQQERRGSVIARLRSVDQARPLLQPSTPLLEARRSVLSGSLRRNAALLSDGSLGTGRLGSAPAYPDGGRAALSPSLSPTSPGVLVTDVPVVGLDGSADRLRARLGRGFLVVLVAPGTAVWSSEYWLGAGLMPQLTEATESLPLPAELLVTEAYPGAVPHTVLLIRPDGHLVAALRGCHPDDLWTLADRARGSHAELPTPRAATPTRASARASARTAGGGRSRGPADRGSAERVAADRVPSDRVAADRGRE